MRSLRGIKDSLIVIMQSTEVDEPLEMICISPSSYILVKGHLPFSKIHVAVMF